MKNLSCIGYPSYAVTTCGKVFSLRRGRFLNLHKNHKGYLLAALTENKVTKKVSVHRLVAMAYISNPEGKETVNHIDGNKTNNDVSNLEWNTLSENIKHAHDNKLAYVPNKNLTDETVHKICDLISQGFRNCDISKMLDVRINQISDIRKERCYVYISKDYDMKSFKRIHTVSINKIIKICEMLQEGTLPRVIAETVGASVATVRNVKNRKSHTDISDSFKW